HSSGVARPSAFVWKEPREKRWRSRLGLVHNDGVLRWKTGLRAAGEAASSLYPVIDLEHAFFRLSRQRGDCATVARHAGVQTHPDVLVIPPDPPQMMIKVDQVRRVIETIYFRPGEAKERVYIFTDSNFMKEAANSLLKILEEPPEFATIFLLTDNAGELLPT